jgi:hypothetical protein
MRHVPNLKADRYRAHLPGLPQERGENWGYFEIPTPKGRLRVVASDGIGGEHADQMPPEAVGWEHVSVSLATRCPTWPEMCLVKDLFWTETQVVVQFHPAKAQYVDIHPYTLHLWRHLTEPFPMPPAILVGPNSQADLDRLREEMRKEAERR